MTATDDLERRFVKELCRIAQINPDDCELDLQAFRAALAASPPRIVSMDNPQADDATHLHIGDENDIARWGRMKKELARIPEMEAQVAQMREALTALVDETCDYMRINNLGDPEKQHNIKLARKALTTTDATACREQIRREALEEAAKVAEAYPSGAVSRNSTGDKIATAIRSLTKGDG